MGKVLISEVGASSSHQDFLLRQIHRSSFRVMTVTMLIMTAASIFVERLSCARYCSNLNIALNPHTKPLRSYYLEFTEKETEICNSPSQMVSKYQNLVLNPEMFTSKPKVFSAYVLLSKMAALGNTQKHTIHPKAHNTIKQLTSFLLV